MPTRRRAVPRVFLVALVMMVPLRAAAQRAAPADTILARPISLSLRDATLTDALSRLRHGHGVPLAYSGDILPPHHRVSLVVRDAPLGEVLDRVLAGSGLQVVVTREGSLVVVPRDGGGDTAPQHDRHHRAAITQALTATGVRQLDELIVMGSPVAGAPEREQPTTIGVAGPAQLDGAAHTSMADLMRTLLPGVVLWQAGLGGGPPRVTSVRGVSSFTSRGLKSYVDGVELASPDFLPLLDARAIERLEILRGPQGAALYGPDALNGILQVETRVRQPGRGGLALRGSLIAGPHEPGKTAAAALWQDHAGSLSAGGARWGAEGGVGWAQAGAREGAFWHQQVTGQGGATLLLGPVLVRGTARAGRLEYAAEQPPEVPAVPALQEVSEQSVGISLLHAPSSGWRQSVVVGFHRVSGPRETARAFVLNPLLPLGATHERASRASIRYATSWELGGEPLQATLSGGAEYSRRDLARSTRRAAPVAALAPLFEDELHTTGSYGQLRVRVGSSLVLTAGSRVEWGSSVAATDAPAWASTLGASWSRPVGRSTLRFRGAWGRGLRLPEPGMNRAMATATIRLDPNDALRAERQSGVEAGADLYLAGGSWARVTWYDQRADDLIQQVQVRREGAIRAFQFQNVGAIANRGVELEAGVGAGPLTVTGLLYLTRSTITRTVAAYTGDLQPGDPLPEVPSAAGSLVLRYLAGALTMEAGASWLGGWTGFDRVAALQAESGEVAPRQAPRDYWLDYAGLVRPHLAVGLDLGAGLSAFVRADNPTRQRLVVRDNLTPPIGRTAVVGLTLRR